MVIPISVEANQHYHQFMFLYKKDKENKILYLHFFCEHSPNKRVSLFSIFSRYFGMKNCEMLAVKHAVQTVMKEAIQMINESSTPGPGSEYMNAVAPGKR